MEKGKGEKEGGNVITIYDDFFGFPNALAERAFLGKDDTFRLGRNLGEKESFCNGPTGAFNSRIVEIRLLAHRPRGRKPR